MSQKNLKGTVSIFNDNNRIRLRWRFHKKQYSLNYSFYSKDNLSKAKKLAATIEQDMAFDVFDFSLVKYKLAAGQKASSGKSIVERFEYWTTNYKQMSCDVHKNYHTIRAMLKKWSNVDENNILQRLNSETFNERTYNRRLSMLKNFATWMVKHHHWRKNPFDEVQAKRTKKKDNSKRKPFTEDEIRKVLDALKNDTYRKPKSPFVHSHYYPFVYFIFKTGVRNAEAVGLRVKHVDLSTNLINIKEVLARPITGSHAAVRIRKETKNGKERVIPITEDLKAILLPLLENKTDDDLVFQSSSGQAIDDRMFQRRVFKPVLKELGIPERVLYAARHTFGSRCLDMGMTPVMTSFLMGNNPETLLRNYTHQISLPDTLPRI